MEKLGIDVTTKVIIFGIKLGEGIEKRLADDGKISLIEGVTLLPVLKDAPGIVRSRKTLVAELKDLSSIELKQIQDLVAEELDLKADKIEVVVEKGINVIVAVRELIDAIQDLRKEEEEPEEYNPEDGFGKK